MPRRARLYLPNVPLHLIQRGHNRQPCFFSSADYQFYLHWLGEHARDTGCAIHAYVLMTNHVHLLLSADHAHSTGAMMKALGQRYVQHINRKYQRSGSLWEGRFRSCPTQDERYLLACHRYIELNPVRAGLVDYPGDYRWSSYRANAHGDSDALVHPHAIYRALGSDQESRLAAYRALFRYDLAPALIDQIRCAANGNAPLGDARFIDRIEADNRNRTVIGPAGGVGKR
jgi:putative transposase